MINVALNILEGYWKFGLSKGNFRQCERILKKENHISSSYDQLWKVRISCGIPLGEASSRSNIFVLT